MDEIENKETVASTHKIGIYLWIWGLLFVLSFFSYMVDLVCISGVIKVDLNFNIYVSKSWFNNGFLYAPILGAICPS